MWSRHTVRDIMAVVIDAEVQGDQEKVVKLLKLLRDRRKIPLKIFSFHEDYRPGYIGEGFYCNKPLGKANPSKAPGLAHLRPLAHAPHSPRTLLFSITPATLGKSGRRRRRKEKKSPPMEVMMSRMQLPKPIL
jgi:hypothetical protein